MGNVMADPILEQPVTQWFEGKPIRIGVWEVENTDLRAEHSTFRSFQFWNGHYFCMFADSPAGARGLRYFKSTHQFWRYRGLANPQIERCPNV
jgi:hypothetical protein